MAWSPVGAQLAVASAAGALILSDFETCLEWPLRDADGQGLDAIAFSGDGRWLAAGGESGSLSLWRLDRPVPELQPVPPLRGWLEQLAWQPHGDLLAVARGAEICLWSLRTQTWWPPLRASRAAVMALTWSSTGDQLVVAGGEGVFLWPAPCEAGMVSAPRHLPTGSAVLQLHWGQDPAWLVAGLIDHRLIVWRDLLQPPLGVAALPGKIHAVQLARLAGGKAALLVAAADLAILWTESGHELEDWGAAALPWHADRVTALALGPAQAPVATASNDGTVALWDEAGTLLQVLETDGQAFTTLAWRTDGRELAAGGEDGEWVLWPLENRPRAEG
jgi:WD40 repeat protein